MQPYFFPYIGYFQLIAASDVFVLHDDVQYIKGGWVNRNRILLNSQIRMVTFPVQKGSYDLPINARNYVGEKQVQKDVINLIRQAYARAPYFREVFPLIEELVMFEERNVARFNENLIRKVSNYIGLSCKIINSSSVIKNDTLSGEARVLDLCMNLGATDYTNPTGGIQLYHHDSFQKSGITLRFLKSDNVSYQQQTNTWVPFLSIIDVLMFNSVDAIGVLLTKRQILSQFELEGHH